MITAENGHEYLVMPHPQNAPHILIHDRRIRTSLIVVWGHRDRWATPFYTCTQAP
jgi:predicted neuraminidase